MKNEELINQLIKFSDKQKPLDLLNEVDELLEWHLKIKSSIKKIYNSLEILIPDKNTVLLILKFLQENDSKSFEELFNELNILIQEESPDRQKHIISVYSKLKFISAKYIDYLFESFEAYNSPYAWKQVRNKILVAPKPEVEVTIIRNDLEEFIVRDGVQHLITLATLLLEDTMALKDVLSEDDREEAQLEFKELVKLIKKMNKEFFTDR